MALMTTVVPAKTKPDADGRAPVMTHMHPDPTKSEPASPISRSIAKLPTVGDGMPWILATCQKDTG